MTCKYRYIYISKSLTLLQGLHLTNMSSEYWFWPWKLVPQISIFWYQNIDILVDVFAYKKWSKISILNLNIDTRFSRLIFFNPRSFGMCLWNGWCRTVLLRAVTSAQPMPAACQSFLLQPSTFAFSGCEGAKRQRLCRPSGNPVGVNLAGVSLFRMRAHGWRWGLWRAFGTADAARCCSGPLRSPNQCLLLAKAPCFTRPPLLLGGSKVPNGSGSANQVHPLGPNLAGVSLFRMRAHRWRWGLWRAFGMADAARFCSGPLRPPNQCLPLAKASCFNRPPLLLVGAKVPNGSGSADLVATRWAWILLGFPCFGCVLTGDAGGCDVPLERLMPHGAARGRYVRPTNACCLPKLPASPVHLCF